MVTFELTKREIIGIPKEALLCSNDGKNPDDLQKEKELTPRLMLTHFGCSDPQSAHLSLPGTRRICSKVVVASETVEDETQPEGE